MDKEVIFVLAVEFGFLAIPIVAVALYRNFKGNKKFVLYLLCVVGLLALARYFNFTLKGDLAHLLLPIAIYFSYCFLICYSLLIKNIFLRITIFIIALLPIAIGYLVGTFGILGVMMISAEEVCNKTVDLGGNYYYREYKFGNATTDEGGTKIEIYKSTFFFPVAEKKILSKKLDYRYFDTDGLKVKLGDKDGQLKIKIYSKDKLQLDTTLKK